jgi:hypothetical protein
MNESEARARFLRASKDFEHAKIMLRPQVLFNRQSSSLGRIEDFFSRFAPPADLQAVPRRLSLKQADDGLVAAHDVLYALADKTTSAIELLKYATAMDALTAELTRVVAAELRNSAALYAPFTAAFKASAKTLKEAKAKAEELIAGLGLAADVLGAFGKLVAVL